MADYTKRVDGIQVRDCVWASCPPSNKIMYDVVKWKTRPTPTIVRNGRTGQLEYSFESCYSLAHLIWNPKEEEFEFEGVGTRWLEEAPSKEVCNMLLEFCKEVGENLKEGVL